MHSLGEKKNFQPKSLSTFLINDSLHMSHIIWVTSNKSYNTTQIIWVIWYELVFRTLRFSQVLDSRIFPSKNTHTANIHPPNIHPPNRLQWISRSREIILATDFLSDSNVCLNTCAEGDLRIWHLEKFSMPDRTEFRTECLLWWSGSSIRKV